MAAPPTSTPPPGAPPSRLERGRRFHSMDRLFAAVLAVSLAVHVSAYVALAQAPVRAEEPTLEEIPDRFARLIIPERRPEPKRKEEAPKSAPVEKVAEPKKEEVAEVKRDAAPEPAETAERKAARAAAVARAVQSKGILKVLGSLGGGASAGSAVANVFGSGASAATDVAAALSGASGVAVAADPGATSTRRGGGENAPARIGDLAPGGEPPPARVSLGVKSEVAVATAAVAVEEAEIDSAEVDQAKLGAFIRARMGLVKACYENQLKRDPGLRGKVRIRFTILETGALDEIVAIENGLGSAEVVSCIVGTMRAWRTPFRPSETVTVEHGFVFSAS